MIRRVAWVNSSHPYLENDPSPSLVSHHLRISSWLRFRMTTGSGPHWQRTGMGTFLITVDIADPRGQRFEAVEMLVDIGATSTKAPETCWNG